MKDQTKYILKVLDGLETKVEKHNWLEAYLNLVVDNQTIDECIEATKDITALSDDEEIQRHFNILKVEIVKKLLKLKK